MEPKWHIAFCNVTYTEYAKVRYREYYGSPECMLESQLAAKDHAERRYGVGGFIQPHVDMPACAFASLLGMPVVEPEEDEIAYLDTSRPLVTDVDQADRIRLGNPRTQGWLARAWRAWQYYTSKGLTVSLGGHGGAIVSTAFEVSGGAAMAAFVENPEGARRLLDAIVSATEALAAFDASLAGQSYQGATYTGDDLSGFLSPRMYREFAVPCYARLYAGNSERFMHSELLRAEHLRIARDEVGITDFHGAGCKNLTLEEMHGIMGHRFWTQVTPQEMLELSPAAITERVRVLAQSGCAHVQLYPGRGVLERTMEAAVAACRRECPGGPAW